MFDLKALSRGVSRIVGRSVFGTLPSMTRDAPKVPPRSADLAHRTFAGASIVATAPAPSFLVCARIASSVI